MVRTEPDRTEWERVLWRLQPFADNYVPPTFLAGLSKNRNQMLLQIRITKFLLFLQQMFFRIGTGH